MVFNNDRLNRVRVVQSDILLTNGVLHLLERVMYINSMTAEWTSAAPQWQGTVWILVVSWIVGLSSVTWL